MITNSSVQKLLPENVGFWGTRAGSLYLGSSGLHSLECEEAKSLAAFQVLMANESNIKKKKHTQSFLWNQNLTNKIWQNYDFYSSCSRIKLSESLCQTYFYAILFQWPHQEKKSCQSYKVWPPQRVHSLPQQPVALTIFREQALCFISCVSILFLPKRSLREETVN